MSMAEALDVVPKIPEIFDEPFADASQLPTYLVARMARQDVKVVLSGDGGDELFVGYNRYALSEPLYAKIGWIPRRLRKLGGPVIRALLGLCNQRYLELLLRWGQGGVSLNRPGEKIEKLARIFDSESLDELYEKSMCYWVEPEKVILRYPGDHDTLGRISGFPLTHEFIERAMFCDLAVYLPDDNLVKVDRATMAVGLEGRAPLLDYRVVEFAASVPLTIKFRGQEKKWLLKKVLSHYLPSDLIERPKMGFSVPLELWLRQELREWAESLLDEKALKEQGVFDVGAVRKRWNEHLSGRANWQNAMWSVLMFQSWRKEYLN